MRNNSTEYKTLKERRSFGKVHKQTNEMSKDNIMNNDDIIIRLKELKNTVLEIIDTEYKYALLILNLRIDECIEKPTEEKLIYLQIVATDLNTLYKKYGKTEEILDYIYSETNEILILYKN